LLLLDTNHCFRIIAGDQRLMDRLSRIARDAVLISVVVAGELYYGAAKSEQIDANWSDVDEFLRLFAVVPVSSSVAVEFGRLKAALLNRFGPRERAKRRDFDLATLGLDDNDLWIAATALDRDAVLVSADSDFVRMADVVDLEVEDWTRA